MVELTDHNDDHVLLLRCDGNERIGYGHSMRCLALAQSWQDFAGPVYWATTGSDDFVIQKYHDHGVSIHEWSVETGSSGDCEELVKFAHRVKPAWTVLDGYDFDESYMERLNNHDFFLMVMDDNADHSGYPADIVLNQTPYASVSMYRGKTPQKSTHLLGTKYVLFRDEIIRNRPATTDVMSSHSSPRVLVTFGGTDQKRAYRNVLQAVRSLPDERVRFIFLLPEDSMDVSEFRMRTRKQVEIHHQVESMGQYIRNIDLVVSGAGTTSLELAYYGVPMLLVVLAENQRRIAESLEEAGAAENLGEVSDLDPGTLRESLVKLLRTPDQRTMMANAGRTLIDGKGRSRAINRMLEVMNNG